MEYPVKHKDFIKNKITLQLSPTKIQVMYNGEEVKGKRGKFYLEDDNRKTREIKIGNLYIGGENPIIIQSMTNTPTEDVEKTVAQIKEFE